MIKGIGTDITDIARIRRILADQSGERFLRRVLTAGEMDVLAMRPQRAAEFAAGRFAAKEALSKAMGCGIGDKIGFQDIVIKPDRLGKPEVRLTDRSRQALGLGALDVLHITISHSDDYAVAFAVWEAPAFS